MKKTIRLHASPFHPPIETAFNLTLTLTAPYSSKEVTLIINGNTTDYQESIKGQGFEAAQITVTEGTPESIMFTFDLNQTKGYGLKMGGELYEILLLNIDKQLEQGQEFLFFDFEINNRSDEKVAFKIESEGESEVTFDPKLNPETFSPNKHILWGKFYIEKYEFLVLSKGQVVGLLLNSKEAPFISLFETDIDSDPEKKHVIKTKWDKSRISIYFNNELIANIDPQNLK